MNMIIKLVNKNNQGFSFSLDPSIQLIIDQEKRSKDITFRNKKGLENPLMEEINNSLKNINLKEFNILKLSINNSKETILHDNVENIAYRIVSYRTGGDDLEMHECLSFKSNTYNN